MKIQLLIFEGCPSADPARAVLERVLARAGVTEPIEELDTTAPGTAEELRDWGSPTILIDGVDIEGLTEPTGPGCRLYVNAEGGMSGTPPDSLLAAAVQRATRDR